MEEFQSKDTWNICKVSIRTSESHSYCSVNILVIPKELFIIEPGIISKRKRTNPPSFLIQNYMKPYILVFVYEVLNFKCKMNLPVFSFKVCVQTI